MTPPFNPDTLTVPTVLKLSEDGLTVSIQFIDVPVVDVDDLFMLMGTEEARDELLIKLAEALANQAKKALADQPFRGIPGEAQ